MKKIFLVTLFFLINEIKANFPTMKIGAVIGTSFEKKNKNITESEKADILHFFDFLGPNHIDHNSSTFSQEHVDIIKDLKIIKSKFNKSWNIKTLFNVHLHSFKFKKGFVEEIDLEFYGFLEWQSIAVRWEEQFKNQENKNHIEHEIKLSKRDILKPGYFFALALKVKPSINSNWKLGVICGCTYQVIEHKLIPNVHEKTKNIINPEKHREIHDINFGKDQKQNKWKIAFGPIVEYQFSKRITIVCALKIYSVNSTPDINSPHASPDKSTNIVKVASKRSLIVFEAFIGATYKIK